MDRQGQGAIEYLLIIGAAILVVAVVIIALVSVSSSATENTGAEDVNATLVPACKEICENTGGTWNAETNKCSDATPALTGSCAIYNS
jgi:hypothetical protein